MSKLKIHIGGQEPHPEWKILDVEDGPAVDFIANANDLSQFEDNSIAMIYASHVLEHFYYGLNNELIKTLKEWRRVLEPEGKLFISVPDLKTLCWLYIHPEISVDNRHHLMRMIFGGQLNQYDVHKVGLDIDTLGLYVANAGFSNFESVEEFGIFNDSSSLRFLGFLISLNVIITK